jgi:hypothetical protein
MFTSLAADIDYGAISLEVNWEGIEVPTALLVLDRYRSFNIRSSPGACWATELTSMGS